MIVPNITPIQAVDVFKSPKNTFASRLLFHKQWFMVLFFTKPFE